MQSPAAAAGRWQGNACGRPCCGVCRLKTAVDAGHVVTRQRHGNAKKKKNGVQAVARGDEWEHGVEPMHIRHSPHRWPDAPHHRPFSPNSRNLEIRVSNGKVTTTGRSWDFGGDLSSTAQSADRRLSRWISSSRSTSALLGTGVRLRGHPPLPPPRHRVGYSTHSRLATVHSRRGAVSPGSGICPDAGRCPRCPRLPIPPRPSQSPR